MRSLLTISLLLLCTQPQAESLSLLISRLPLAGSQYHALERVWDEIRPGDTLSLVREPRHPHDGNAIRVDWHGHPIGYIPRRRNQALATAMDAGMPLNARVEQVRQHRDPWQRMELAVFANL